MGMAGYSLLVALGLGLSAPWWLWRMATSGRYRAGLRERLGQVPRQLQAAVAWVAGERHVVWVHAVSVGEVLAVERLVSELREALPGWMIAVSTTTATGQEVARKRLPGVPVFFFPLDFAFAVRRYLCVLRPSLVVLVESELWPRLVVECERARVPVAVVNARVSDRSFRRTMPVRGLWRRMAAKVSVFLAQGEESAGRLRRLGVAEGRIVVSGNLKYDIEPAETPFVKVLRPLLAKRKLIVAGSLLEPEESMLLRLGPELWSSYSELVLLLAPRHFERFGSVAALARQVHPGAEVYLASELMAQSEGKEPLKTLRSPAIVVLDTLGDLAAVYALADVAFVGGSLVSRGGHNPLEPARFGVPVVVGSSHENFREIVDAMVEAHGIRVVQDERELGSALLELLNDRETAEETGRRGKTVFATRAGATERMVAALLDLIHA